MFPWSSAQFCPCCASLPPVDGTPWTSQVKPRFTTHKHQLNSLYAISTFINLCNRKSRDGKIPGLANSMAQGIIKDLESLIFLLCHRHHVAYSFHNTGTAALNNQWWAGVSNLRLPRANCWTCQPVTELLVAWNRPLEEKLYHRNGNRQMPQIRAFFVFGEWVNSRLILHHILTQ